MRDRRDPCWLQSALGQHLCLACSLTASHRRGPANPRMFRASNDSSGKCFGVSQIDLPFPFNYTSNIRANGTAAFVASFVQVVNEVGIDSV